MEETFETHYNLFSHVNLQKMPLGVVYVEKGKHSQRHFHDHDHSEIVLILDGNAKHMVDGRKAAVTAGDILLIHPETMHAYDDIKNTELVNVIYDSEKLFLPVLDGSNLPMFKKFFPADPHEVICSAEPILHLDEENFTIVRNMIRDMHKELNENHAGSQLYSMSLLIALVVTLCRLCSCEEDKNNVPFRIGTAISFIKKNYRSNIRIDELSKLCNMSQRNFFHLFKKVTGCSPLQYQIRLRLAHAAEKLLYSDMSVADIAIDSGFSDSNYFCRKFHEINKMSPRTFRLRMRQNDR